MRQSFQQWVMATLWAPPPTSPPKDMLVRTALIRGVINRSSWRQLKYGSPATSAVYKKWIEQPAQKELGYEHTVEDLASDPGGSAAIQTRLLWIGKPWQRGDGGEAKEKKDKKKVLLYLHGGGFIMSMCEPQAQWMSFIKEEAKRAHGHDVSVAIVEYCTFHPAALFCPTLPICPPRKEMESAADIIAV